jgi:hypothetical protein
MPQQVVQHGHVDGVLAKIPPVTGISILRIVRVVKLTPLGLFVLRGVGASRLANGLTAAASTTGVLGPVSLDHGRLRKGTNPDPIALDDGKHPDPVIAACQDRNDPGVVDGGVRPFDAKQDDSTGGRQSGVKGQFAEVRVAGDGDALVDLCLREKHVVRRTSKIFLGPHDVVTQFPQPANRRSRDVLVREKAHDRAARS